MRIALCAGLVLAIGFSGLSSPSAEAADAIPGATLCPEADAGTVTRIAFEGNRVTLDEILLRELPQQVGEPCDLDAVIDGLTALFDLGLFRSVRAEFHRDASAQRGTELRYVVAEKFFFLGLPRLSRTTDGELRAGVSLEWDNFLGRLHELTIRSEWRQEDEGRGRAGVVHALDYRVPRFLGSRYGGAVRLRADDRAIDLEQDGVDHGEGRREGYAIGGSLARWLDGSDGVQGLRVFVGAGVEHRNYTSKSGVSGPFEGGVDASVSIGIEDRRVHRERWRRNGTRRGASFAFASEHFGSDFTWHRADFWVANYRPIGGGQRNLNLRATLGISDGAPYGERFYSVGGGNLLRGVETGYRDGDVQFVVNAELLDGFYARPEIRWVLFADVGNAWHRDDIDVADVELRGGVGLRWKIERISNADLRVDLAWNPDRNRIEPYLATRVTF